MQVNDHVVRLLRNTLAGEGTVEISSSGSSMYPLIREGNRCRFVPLGEDPVNEGDIILYHSPRGALVGHRVHRVFECKGETYYLCKGDSNRTPDEPVPSAMVLGRMDRIKKKRYTLLPGRGIAKLWGLFMIHVPALSGFIRLMLRSQYFGTPIRNHSR